MELYSSKNETKKRSKTEALKLFFQKVFLISSAIFAVLIPLVIWSENLNKVTGPYAIVLAYVWFISFAGWILFILLSSKIGGYIINLYMNKGEEKKRIGYLLLIIWIVLLITLSFLIWNNQRLNVASIDPINLAIDRILVALLIIILPLIAFLFKSKIFKILSVIPVLLIIIYLFILRPHKIVGNSMTPNLVNGQYIFSEKVSYFFTKPKRGDIIIYKLGYEKTSSENIARVIAVPGDKIKISDGFIFINEKLLVEPYINVQTSDGTSLKNDSKYDIGDNQYIVMGDNRFHSSDSRNYGSINSGNIMGRVFYSYWPKDKTGFIKFDRPTLISNFKEVTDLVSQSKFTCTTLGTKMVVGFDNKGQIGCDVKVNAPILNNSFCESQQTHRKEQLVPDLYGRSDQYFATLTGLNLDEQVKVYVYSLDGKMVECLPDLNK